MVTHTYPRFPGDGTAPFLEPIVRGLSERGHSIDLLLPQSREFQFSSGQDLRFLPYRYSPLGRWSPWGFGNSLRSDAQIRKSVLLMSPLIVLALRSRIARLMNEHRYELVHAHWAVPNGWLSAGAARRRDVPLLVSLYGSDVSIAERSAPLRWAARSAFASAAAVTTCSDDLRARAVAVGADPRRIRTIRHGVDLAGFDPQLADAILRRELTQGRTDDLLIAAVGRLIEVKGFRYLVEAAARVPGIQVVVVGDGELRPELEHQARELSAPVRFLGNLVHHREVAAVMATADAIVVPSVVDRGGRVDGLPSTVLEALASGRPVIATKVGGIPEIVRDGVNGLLVPQKEPEALAHAIERLKRSPEERRRLGEEARRTAVTSMSWDETVDGFAACYEQVKTPSR
jgi:phosphatidyl-myo-inositol dimannoside synthase